jgi:hypothetical protein
MVILNKNAESVDVETNRFEEILNGYATGKNVITGEIITNLDVLHIPAKSALILDLKR